MSQDAIIEPRLLNSLGDLSLLARSVVEGFLSGLHRSPFLGYSTEFASYRPYIQGDNLRHVDWKVWGRTDELYVKQFEDDTNLYSQVLLDTSGSMNFGNPNKFQYGRTLAAALAYLMVRQHDAPGLTLFGDGAVRALPARSNHHHLDDVLQMLANAQAGGRTIIGADLWNVLETFIRRGVAIVISDLFGMGDGIIELLRQLQVVRQEIIVFHIVAPEEADFNFEGHYLMEDSETGEQLPIHAGAFRKEYHRRFAEFCRRVEEECEQTEADYRRLRTDTPLEHALTLYLEERMTV